MTSPIHSHSFPSNPSQKPLFSSDEIKKIKTVATSILAIISMLFLLPAEVSIPLSLMIGIISHLMISKSETSNIRISHMPFPQFPIHLYPQPRLSPSSSFPPPHFGEPVGARSSAPLNLNQANFHQERTAYIPPAHLLMLDPSIREIVQSRSPSSSQLTNPSYFLYNSPSPSQNRLFHEPVGERFQPFSSFVSSFSSLPDLNSSPQKFTP